MKISRNDPFNLNLCIRGLGNLLTFMHSDIYEYMYYLTFKRSMRAYKKEFNDALHKSIDDGAFFEDSTDLYVKSCTSACHKIMYCKLELALRWGIDEIEDLENVDLKVQAQRFKPFFLVSKRSKSYRKMVLFYERTLSGIIESLYLYACALTAKTYKIPLVLKRQFKLPDAVSLWLLNQEDNDVELIKELIIELKTDLSHFKLLIENKGKLPKIARVKKTLALK